MLDIMFIVMFLTHCLLINVLIKIEVRKQTHEQIKWLFEVVEKMEEE